MAGRFTYSIFLLFFTIFGRRVIALLNIDLREGKLRGIEQMSVLTGQLIYSFVGIPYAEPPIGELRFQAPVPIKKWDGVLDALKEAPMCIQMGSDLEVFGSEDCLYLNVYTPEPPSQVIQKKAVIVFIHGGDFNREGSIAYGPDVLINYDVILVTFNYRLHVFGFLNTGTPSSPGNAGLKDQLLAMRWVKTNIASFGGDPENITLAGQGAGAVSVHLHMLSPASKGLFHRAILQSGNALSPGATEIDPETRARDIGELAGYGGEDLEELVEHLKSETADRLTRLANHYLLNWRQQFPGRCSPYVFIPSVEKIEQDAFLIDFPETLMESATPIPTIIGFNEHEGFQYYLGSETGMINFVLNDLSLAVRNNFELDKNEQDELLQRIETFYFEDRPVTPSSVPEIMNLYGDLYTMNFYEAFDHLIRSKVPPYINLFSYNGNMNLTKAILQPYINFENIEGAVYGDELGYLFFTPNVFPDANNADQEVMKEICSLWTNFAKTGKPTQLSNVDWKPHTLSRPCYMRIDRTSDVFKEELRKTRFDFWRKWMDKFYL